MARLWDALKPAVGASAPWSTIPGILIPGDTVSAPSLGISTPSDSFAIFAERLVTSGQFPVDTASRLYVGEADATPQSAPPLDVVDDFSAEGLLEEAPDLAPGLDEGTGAPLWEDSDQSGAFLEVGPKDDIQASQGVPLPQFTWKPALIIGGAGEGDPFQPLDSLSKPQIKAPPTETDFPRIARHRKTVSPEPVQGTVSPVVVEGIMERLLQRTAADVHPWLFLSPPVADPGLSVQKIDDVVQNVLEGLLVHCGEICVLELDGPADGSSPTVGPGWHQVLLGRVDCQGALREGRKTGIWRFPSGSTSNQGGPWFAARSIQGVARELRQRFPLVVISSPTGITTPLGRLWTSQCQGWTWVVSAKTWETTQLEETAQALTKSMPPWIGCVLVDD